MESLFYKVTYEGNSATYDVRRSGFNLQYKLNEETISPINKIFVFKTHKDTLNFINTHCYGNSNKLIILSGIGKNPHKITRCADLGFSIDDYFEEFWKSYKNKKKFRWTRPTLDNTYIVDSYKPLYQYNINEFINLIGANYK